MELGGFIYGRSLWSCDSAQTHLGDQVTISVPRLGSMRTASDWCHIPGLASPQQKKKSMMKKEALSFHLDDASALLMLPQSWLCLSELPWEITVHLMLLGLRSFAPEKMNSDGFGLMALLGVPAR